MKKTLFFLIFIITININLFSQSKNEYFFKKIEFGSSLTYIWQGSLKDNLFNEFTWNLNATVSLNKRFSIGIQSQNIFFKIQHETIWKYAYINGFVSQFTFFDIEDLRFYGEISLHKGNYCSVYDENIWDYPIIQENIYYYGFGGGFEIQLKTISERLIFEFAFFNYNILNRIEKKYNHTQYIIGLNYIIGKI